MRREGIENVDMISDSGSWAKLDGSCKQQREPEKEEEILYSVMGALKTLKKTKNDNRFRNFVYATNYETPITLLLNDTITFQY